MMALISSVYVGVTPVQSDVMIASLVHDENHKIKENEIMKYLLMKLVVDNKYCFKIL